MAEVEWPQAVRGLQDQELMMLPTDYVLVQDKKFREWVYKYAKSQELFFNDFSKAFSTLLELGIPTAQFPTGEPWIMKTTDEQKA